MPSGRVGSPPTDAEKNIQAIVRRYRSLLYRQLYVHARFTQEEVDRLIGKEKTLPQNMKAKFQSRIERLQSVSAIIIDLLYFID